MLESIPPLLLHFLMTIVFSFIVGLEFHNYIRTNQYQYGFGSIRTLLLIGLLGFILFQLRTDGLFFMVGIGLMGALLGIYYWHQSTNKHYSVLEIIIALLVFLTGPVAVSFPVWFLVLFAVLLILMLGEKPLIHQFSETLESNEVVTLAKFLVISGVILPLLPDKQIADSLPVTYYKVWQAVIIVSGFSYLSYLAQQYVFKSRGLLLTGLLGGLYSSTAVTVVISRRARHMKDDWVNVSSALMMATAMMYLRLLVIIFLLDNSIAQSLFWFFSVLIVLSIIATGSVLYFSKGLHRKQSTLVSQHPLELQTALLFAFMFVLFAFITQYVVSHFGHYGLNLLSWFVGLTDIDPFILSLLSGKFPVPENRLISAVIIASASNNILKAVYAMLLSRNRSVLPGVGWLLMLSVISCIYVLKISAIDQ